jgi:hypothetical protein
VSDQDAADIVLNQAIVCAYAVPVAGAAIAAGLSIVQAIIDALRPKDVDPPAYTVARAISDLGDQISRQLHDLTDRQDIAKVAGWQDDLSSLVRTNADLRNFDAAAAKAAASAFAGDQDYNAVFAALSAPSVKTPGEQVASLAGTWPPAPSTTASARPT